MKRALLMVVLLLVGLPLPAFADEAPVVHEHLNLEAAVQRALSLRPELRAAAADVAIQQALSDQTRASLRPSASISAFGISENTGMIYSTTPSVRPQFLQVFGNQSVLDVNLAALMPLSTGGRIEHQVAAASLAAEGSRQAQKLQVLDVVLDARKRFLTALESREAIGVVRETLDKDAEGVRVAQIQFDAGKVPRLAMLRARTELAAVQQTLNDAVAQSEMAESDLKLALGVSQKSVVDLDDTLEAPAPPPDLPALVDLALAQRPDLQAARMAVRQADEDIKSVQAAYNPEVYLNGMAEGNGTSIGVTMSLPVLDGGDRRARLAAASGTRARRVAQADALVQAVVRDVTRAHIGLKTQYANLQLAEPAVTEAEENYRVARLRFEAGRSIQLEILDALAVLSRARINRLKALYAYQTARAEMDWSLGSWENVKKP